MTGIVAAAIGGINGFLVVMGGLHVFGIPGALIGLAVTLVVSFFNGYGIGAWFASRRQEAVR